MFCFLINNNFPSNQVHTFIFVLVYILIQNTEYVSCYFNYVVTVLSVCRNTFFYYEIHSHTHYIIMV